MGQQQLLLIVLGVIIVGVAVVVGINLFNANAEESAKDSISSEGVSLAAMAQQFYKKPVALGGGGNTFMNGTVSWGTTTYLSSINMLQTNVANWLASTATSSSTHLFLAGTPRDYTSWSVGVMVSATSIQSKILQPAQSVGDLAVSDFN
jgi:hypothetical protein